MRMNTSSSAGTFNRLTKTNTYRNNYIILDLHIVIVAIETIIQQEIKLYRHECP